MGSSQSDHRVISLAPGCIDREDVQWPYTQRQKQGSTKAGPVGEEGQNSSCSCYSIL